MGGARTSALSERVPPAAEGQGRPVCSWEQLAAFLLLLPAPACLCLADLHLHGLPIQHLHRLLHIVHPLTHHSCRQAGRQGGKRGWLQAAGMQASREDWSGSQAECSTHCKGDMCVVLLHLAARGNSSEAAAGIGSSSSEHQQRQHQQQSSGGRLTC